jgi:hypothetical protein
MVDLFLSYLSRHKKWHLAYVSERGLEHFIKWATFQGHYWTFSLFSSCQLIDHLGECAGFAVKATMTQNRKKMYE